MRCTQPPTGQALRAADALRAQLPSLTTERLILRAPRLEDLPVWTAIHQAEGAEFIGGPADEKTAWAFFGLRVADWLLHGHGLFTVTLRDNGTVVGFAFLGLEWTDAEPELGYMFDASHRGKGYATEACTAVRDFGTALLGAGNFVSYVDAKNAPSNALARRLGAVRDAGAEASFGDGHTVWRYGGAA